MQHLILYFEHDIRDIIPYSHFIQEIRGVLADATLGEYLGDDMAIDGGDAEAIFASPDVRALLAFLAPRLRTLHFLHQAKVKLVFGPLESNSEFEEFVLD